MTPYSLNPPGGPSIQAGQTQQQLFNISPNNQDCRTFFNIFDPIGGFRENYQQDESNKMVLLHDGSSSSNCNSSSSFNISPEEDHGCSSTGNKWMSSKMRLMKKMMRPPTTDKPINSTPRFQNQRSTPRNNNNASTATTRVCSDCNTTTTPLWRSGPMGPKSLCNACGIRQRKARRAMAEAAKGLVTAPLNNATKIRVHNKELKKSRSSNHFSQFKNKYKSTTTTTTSHHEGSVRKLEYFKDFSIRLRSTNSSDFHQQEVFPRDEVAEAALLLMDLSCGILSTFN